MTDRHVFRLYFANWKRMLVVTH